MKITRHFITAANQITSNPEVICAVIATFMFHGDITGSYTMAQLSGIIWEN
jgi:hypothetical protein